MAATTTRSAAVDTVGRDEHLAALQRALILLVRRTSVPRVHDQIKALAEVEIELVEAVALGRIVDADGMRLAELARQLAVGCSTASRHVSRLVKRQLATRRPDPDDARAIVLEATDTGREVLARLRRAHCQVLGDALGAWTDDDLETLIGLSRRLTEDLVDQEAR